MQRSTQAGGGLGTKKIKKTFDLSDFKTFEKQIKETKNEEEDSHDFLTTSPDILSQPLQIIDQHAYAVTNLYVKGEAKPKTAIIRNDGKLCFEKTAEKEFKFLFSCGELPEQRLLLSGQGVKRLINGDKVDPIQIFNQLQQAIDNFISFDASLADQETMSKLVALYVLSTWITSLLPNAPYIWFTGTAGSGKSTGLSAISKLSYLGQMVISSTTTASLRETIKHAGFVGIDDCVTITSTKKGDPAKRELLLSGYRPGSTIGLRINNGDQWITERIPCYSSKGFSAIRLPDPTLASRCLIIPLVPCSNKRKTVLEPENNNDWLFDIKTFRDNLWLFALRYLPQLKGKYREATELLPVSGRPAGPWAGIMTIARFLDSIENQNITNMVKGLCSAYQDERAELQWPDPKSVVGPAVIAATIKALDERPERLSVFLRETPTQVTTQAVAEEARIIGEEKEWEADYFSNRRIGAILRSLRIKKGSLIGKDGVKCT